MCLLAAPRAGQGTTRGQSQGCVTRVLNPPLILGLSSFHFRLLLIFLLCIPACGQARADAQVLAGQDKQPVSPFAARAGTAHHWDVGQPGRC